ncbi:MAG: cytochrome P450 [Chloroflexi bacterium]|nr:cytochrome P450 [Chloroflexota bacterium]
MREVSPQGGPFGLLPELGRDALGLLTDVRRDYGDLVRMRLGLTRTVLVSHPKLIEEVLVTRNHEYRKHLGARRLGTLLGNGLLFSEGDFWLRQRRLMQPAFHRQRIQHMGETMVSITSDAMDRWRDGAIRDVTGDMTEITLQIAARTLFGSDVGPDMARIRASSFATTAHFRSRLFSMMILLPDWVPTPGNLRFGRAMHDLNTLVFRIIRERRSGATQSDDLLGMLLAARDDTGQGMTNKQLRDEVMTLILAGHDTTALALNWALVLLAQHPAVRARLQDEVDGVLNGRRPAADDVPRLPYVEQVVTETLRLFPTAWLLGREALRDTTIGGQRIAKRTTVLISPWVVQRDPRFFDEPDAFRPERWADGTLLQSLPRFAYAPFGGGQRVCIGSSFAQLEAMLLLASIAQRFSLSLLEPHTPVEPLPVITLRPKQPVKMRVVARA